MKFIMGTPSGARETQQAPMLKQSKTFFTHLWGLTRPYWFSEERWAARSLLAVVNRAQPRAGVYPRAHQSVEQ